MPHNKYPIETLELVLNLNTSGAITSYIAAKTGLSNTSILDRLYSAGLEPNLPPPSNQITEEQRAKMRYAVKVLKMKSPYAIGKYSCMSHMTARKYMKEGKNFDYVPKQGKPSISAWREQIIYETYLSNRKARCQDIADVTGETYGIVYKYLKKAGYKLHCKPGHPKTLSGQKENKILEVFLSNPRCSSGDIAYIVKDVCNMTVFNKLNKYDYHLYHKRKELLTESQKRILDKDFEEGKSLRESARHAHTTSPTVLSYQRSQELKPKNKPGFPNEKIWAKRRSLEGKKNWYLQ